MNEATQNTPAPEKLWTITEVAEHLSVSQRTIHSYMDDRELPGFKIGGALRFRPREIVAWVERQRRTVDQ